MLVDYLGYQLFHIPLVVKGILKFKEKLRSTWQKKGLTLQKAPLYLKEQGRNIGSRIRKKWVQIPAMSLTSCINLGNSFSLLYHLYFGDAAHNIATRSWHRNGSYFIAIYTFPYFSMFLQIVTFISISQLFTDS